MNSKNISKAFSCFLIILSIFSCSKEDFNDNPNPKTRGIINQEYYSLGTSYDITYNYLDIDATKYPVVDIAAFLKDNPNSYIINNTTHSSISLISGATAEEYAREFAAQTSGSLGISTIICANIKFGSDLHTKNTYTTQYSYGRGDIIKRVKRVYLNATPSMLQNYLIPEFERDLNILSPDDFVQKYGTHVLLDITLGGRIQFDYKSSILETSSLTEKKSIVEAGLKFAIGKFGADASNSYTDQEIITTNKKNATWNTIIEFYGGENSGTTYTYDSEKGLTSTGFNLSSWESSVNDENATIIQINEDKTYPIYDFIKSSTKKEQIQAAVKRYTQPEEIEIIPVKPLYRLFSPNTRNTFFTSSWDEVKHYQNLGYNLDYGKKHYLQGYVFTEEQPNTVPLLRLYKSSNSNTFFTTSYKEAETYKKKGYKPDHGTTNYILGYVYKEYKGEYTLPIYRMYKGSISNTFMTTNYDEAVQYLNEGYNWDKGTTNYIQGYIIDSDI